MKARKLTAQQFVPLIKSFCEAHGMEQIKASYGRKDVQMEYEGGDGFLENNRLVQSFNNYGRYVEVRLATGADAQQLLQQAAAKATINRFELVEPSLEAIFIETVSKTHA